MSETSYPALKKLIETAYARRRRNASWLESTEDALEAAGDAVDYAGAGADLRALFANAATDQELDDTLFAALGCGYDPRDDGTPVREWLENLLKFVDQRAEQTAWKRGLDEPREVRAARLRPLVAAEVERIGAYELGERTRMEPPAILSFLEGGIPDHAALDAFDFYQFGPYPDLRYLMEHFHEDYSESVGSTTEDWEAVVDSYIRDEREGEVRGAAADIGRLLETVGEEAELRRVLDEFRSCFPVERVGMTCREWLSAVRERLARA